MEYGKWKMKKNNYTSEFHIPFVIAWSCASAMTNGIWNMENEKNDYTSELLQ
jgi:hypothetical protein